MTSLRFTGPTATEFLDGGITVEETSQVVRWLAEDGVDFADISTSGNYPAKIMVDAVDGGF